MYLDHSQDKPLIPVSQKVYLTAYHYTHIGHFAVLEPGIL